MITPAIRKRQFELDALRGLAAIYVVIFHYFNMAGYTSVFFDAGVTGVDLFFLISGYVIFMTLEKTKEAKDFIVSRISRLFPSYLVMLAITIFFIHLLDPSSSPGFKNVIFNLTMMPRLFNVAEIDDSYWTLAVEMQFYFIMLLLFIFRKLKYIEWIGSAALLFFLAFFIYYSVYNPDAREFIILTSYFRLMQHFQLFLAGIVFYKIKTEGGNWKRYLVLISCFAANIFLFDKTGKAHFFLNLEVYFIMMVIYFIVFYLFILGRLKFLNLKWLVFGGAISYALYLIHQRVGALLYHSLIGMINQPLLLLFLIIGFMILIAALVTYTIEKPLIELIRNYFGEKRRIAEARLALEGKSNI